MMITRRKHRGGATRRPDRQSDSVAVGAQTAGIRGQAAPTVAQSLAVCGTQTGQVLPMSRRGCRHRPHPHATHPIGQPPLRTPLAAAADADAHTVMVSVVLLAAGARWVQAPVASAPVHSAQCHLPPHTPNRLGIQSRWVPNPRLFAGKLQPWPPNTSRFRCVWLWAGADPHCAVSRCGGPAVRARRSLCAAR
eukprot:COSAG01_NODE_9814_length_2334_cov_2.346309_2_plen_193_part_00